MHVLLVEDNALVASGVKAGLQLQGFGVDVVGCASQADAALKSSHFDVCVLDLGLPDEDGLHLLARWRRQGLELPVLVLTGGSAAWVAAGKPVESDATRLASALIDRYRRPYEGTDNRAEAMQMLKSRLFELEMRNRMAAQQKMEDAKTDVGWGHQIRSYVLDQSRIKDLRTNVEISATQKVLDGDLDAFIEASLKQGV